MSPAVSCNCSACLIRGQRHAVPPLAAQPAELDPLAAPGIAGARPSLRRGPAYRCRQPGRAIGRRAARHPRQRFSLRLLRPQPGRAAGLRTGPCHASARPRRPLALFLSGVSPPAENDVSGYRRAKADAELVAALRDYRGTPEAVLNDPSLMQMLLPVVRADFLVTGSYRYQAHGPLDAALHLFGGREDSLRSAELLGWLHEAGATSPSTCSTGSTFSSANSRGSCCACCVATPASICCAGTRTRSGKHARRQLRAAATTVSGTH